MDRHVSLTGGHLVIDFPVSKRYLELCKWDKEREFTHVRYTAATCDPDTFGRPDSKYELRPAILQRKTELFIVMTMYNEDEELFAKTMTSVSIRLLYVVCIVADGKTKIHPRVLTLLQTMGIYVPDVARSTVDGKPVTAHLFEFTTQLAVDKEMHIRSHKDGIVPVQVLFCLKEKNAKKINSHRWFFNAFGPILSPNVCVLLDVGTKPTGTSIYHLWRAFDRDSRVGGACGEIKAELGEGCRNILNPLVASQNFEYKMSNILDKPLESVFGYIQVLPGAFSAYRYSALQNTSPNVGPLASYFRGETLHGGEADVFSANMYLAEDRILCFELVTKRNAKWVLKYVKPQPDRTQAPKQMCQLPSQVAPISTSHSILLPLLTLPTTSELVSQRRRWLNGSFFAAVHSLTNCSKLFSSGHGPRRKLLFAIQTFYNLVNLMFSWVSIANFYLTFHFLFQAVKDPETDPFHGPGPTIFQVLQKVYFAAIVVQFIISFGNRPQGFPTLYYLLPTLFALIMGFLLYAGFYAVYQNILTAITTVQESTGVPIRTNIVNLLKNSSFRSIVISLASTYGMYAFSSLLHFDVWHVVTSMVQYMFLLPTYTNVFTVYAFCNLHDISWGTKGDNVASKAGSTSSAPTTTPKPGEPIPPPRTGLLITLPTDDPQTLNEAYIASLKELEQKPQQTRTKRDAQTKLDDYFRMYRTKVVLAWLATNGVMIIGLTYPAVEEAFTKWGDGVNLYLAIIFWSVCGLSVVRFLGSCAYLVLWMMERSFDGTFGRKPFDIEKERGDVRRR
ncbi:Chitin synthase, class 1 [Rhizophlyctis rosea]|nr:Chitin synthase, class 1 [Rhizophlyctis rosea]